MRVFFKEKEKLDEVLNYRPSNDLKHKVRVKNLDSNFSNASYLEAIHDIKKMIAKGDFYQTNLTRKFFGEFEKKPNQKESFKLFVDLTKSSSANYSSFLKLDENYIISSSPELFLKVEKSGKIISRPIKGTTPRSLNKKRDHENKKNLKKSEKEKAENLMIVDLVRNDLSRVCRAGSVFVKKLFEITSYQNVHHMSSEVCGKIAEGITSLDVIRNCFPAGSMTGTPKIKAMAVAAKKEKIDRGIYSGAIGFFDNSVNPEINLSVVIRTLILRDKKFEFQTGGAITFDSNPESELEEIFNKAKAIKRLLGIKISS